MSSLWLFLLCLISILWSSLEACLVTFSLVLDDLPHCTAFDTNHMPNSCSAQISLLSLTSTDTAAFLISGLWCISNIWNKKLLPIFPNLLLFQLKKKWYIFSCAGSSLLCRPSLVAESRGYSSLQCMGFSLWWLLLWSTGSRVHRLQQLQPINLVVPWHVVSSWSRDQTGVPCIARQILNHWTTREPPFPAS